MTLDEKIVRYLLLRIPAPGKAGEVIAEATAEFLQEKLEEVKQLREAWVKPNSAFGVRMFNRYDAEVKNIEESIHYLTRKGYDDKFEYS